MANLVVMGSLVDSLATEGNQVMEDSRVMQDSIASGDSLDTVHRPAMTTSLATAHSLEATEDSNRVTLHSQITLPSTTTVQDLEALEVAPLCREPLAEV